MVWWSCFFYDSFDIKVFLNWKYCLLAFWICLTSNPHCTKFKWLGITGARVKRYSMHRFFVVVHYYSHYTISHLGCLSEWFECKISRPAARAWFTKLRPVSNAVLHVSRSGFVELRAHRRIFRALIRKWNVTSGDWHHHIVSWPGNPLTQKSPHELTSGLRKS